VSRDAFADKFPNGGNTHHDRQLEGLDITLAVSDGLVRQCLHAAVATTDADENETQLDYVFEDMHMGEREDIGQKRVVQLEMVARPTRMITAPMAAMRIECLRTAPLDRLRASRGARRVSYMMQATSSLDGVRISVVACGRVRAMHRQKVQSSFADALDLG
jgi:hypothetical protein